MKNYSSRKNKIFKFLIIFIFLYPSNGISILQGLPLDSVVEISFVLTLFFILLKSKYVKNETIFIALFVLLIKTYLIFFPIDMWSVCVKDDTTPRQQSFTYIYYEKDCVKSFDNIFSNYTNKYSEINFSVKSPDFEWMGANSSNFPLGFLNHSAYNFYERRRDWLPFQIYMFKSVNRDVEFVSINYTGSVIVQFDNNYPIKLGSKYDEITSVQIKVPQETNIIKVDYRFKDLQVQKDATHPYNIQNDFTSDLKYAHLKVDLIEQTSSFDKKLAVDFLSYTIFLLIFLLQFKTLENIIFPDVRLVIFLVALVGFNYYFATGVTRIVLNYFVLITIFYFIQRDYFSYFSILFVFYLLNYFIIDLPWNILDFTVKPSGTDILTYENQARLILDGDGFRGGENIFWYSPGYRYGLYIVHLIFGDGWNLSWKIILTVTIFLIIKLSKSTYFLSIPLSIFFIFDNVRTVYLFGMSETLALLLILFGLYFKKNIHLLNIFLSLAVIIRPETILLVLFVFLLNKKNSPFMGLLFFPLIHNLYFGKEFVIFSTAANYGRNLKFNIFENLEYILFNFFNPSIKNIMGEIPTFIGFSISIYSIFIIFYRIIKYKSLSSIYPQIFWILSSAPFLIYDPSLFYPRHLIIPLTMLVLDNKLMENQNKKLNHIFKKI